MPNPVADAGPSTQIAEKLLAEDPHYIAAVTNLGDRQSVIATEDIIGKNGVKLIAKGARVDSRLHEKLAAHRLNKNIDQHLAVENSVTPASLAAAADQLITTHSFWQRLAAHSGDALAMRHGLARLKLPPALAFKLTIAREQRPPLFLHGLRVAVLAHYLALRLGINEKSSSHLLLAALCHDLGEMHTDPAILDPKHRITDEERRFVYVHPATGYVILRDTPGLMPEVARAVLHHHERLDGSGYPGGLDASRIEPLALPLMVADTADAVLQRFADHGRLRALLRLNQRKYDPRSVAMLHEALLAQNDATPDAPATQDDRLPQLRAFAKLLDEWANVRRSLDDRQLAPGKNSLDFLHQRLQNLNSVLYQFGFDPGSFDTLIELSQTDPEVAAELNQVFDELQFQLGAIAQEFDRHSTLLREVLSDVQMNAFASWRKTLQETLQAP